MGGGHDMMGAREYLGSLQSRMRVGLQGRQLHRANIEKWAGHRARQFGVPVELILTGMLDGNPLQNAIDYVVKSLCSRLPASVAESVKDTVVGVLPLRSVNAQCLRAPSGEPLVIVDQGLMTMLHFFLESTVASEHLVRSSDTAESGAWLRLVSYWFVVKYYAYGGELSFPGPWPGSSTIAANYANIGVHAAEEFVLAHELAHLWAGHLSEESVHSAQPEGDTSLAVDFYQRSREEEAEADRLAWEWYRSSLRDDPDLAELGDDALIPPLYMFQMMALVEKNRDRSPAYATHPPAQERLRNAMDCVLHESVIREVVEEMLRRCDTFFPDFRKFSSDDVEALDRILASLGDAP